MNRAFELEKDKITKGEIRNQINETSDDGNNTFFIFTKRTKIARNRELIFAFCCLNRPLKERDKTCQTTSLSRNVKPFSEQYVSEISQCTQCSCHAFDMSSIFYR